MLGATHTREGVPTHTHMARWMLSGFPQLLFCRPLIYHLVAYATGGRGVSRTRKEKEHTREDGGGAEGRGRTSTRWPAPPPPPSKRMSHAAPLNSAP